MPLQVIEADEIAHGSGTAGMNQPAPSAHAPVLPEAVLAQLQPRPGAVFVDATAGRGGHSALLLPRLLPDGRLIAIDRDPEAVEQTRARLVEFVPQVAVVQGDFRDLPGLLAAQGLAQVDGLLADLGMSSPQVDDPARGFSFLREGPLDMRMDPAQPLTAAEIVNTWREGDLEQLFRTLGEERFARRIARRLVTMRRTDPLRSTTHLAACIAAAVPAAARHGRLHPATRCFQALRMAVNDELGSLGALLEALPQVVRPGGRAVIISFHSLEDRLVKHAFLAGQREGHWTVLTRRPVRPSDEDTAQNPRARSAKLRAIEVTA